MLGHYFTFGGLGKVSPSKRTAYPLSLNLQTVFGVAGGRLCLQIRPEARYKLRGTLVDTLPLTRSGL